VTREASAGAARHGKRTAPATPAGASPGDWLDGDRLLLVCAEVTRLTLRVLDPDGEREGYHEVIVVGLAPRLEGEVARGHVGAPDLSVGGGEPSQE